MTSPSGKFGQLPVQRDFLDRTVTLVIGGGAEADITHHRTQTPTVWPSPATTASLQINPVNSGQLGSDERVKLFSGVAPMASPPSAALSTAWSLPWMINGTDVQFLTYTADNGFVNAGFDGIRSGALGATSVPTERTFINAASTIIGGAGLALDTYALRLDDR